MGRPTTSLNDFETILALRSVRSWSDVKQPSMLADTEN